MASHNQRITILENSSGTNINATAPIKYIDSTISADFGTAPLQGSNLLLDSGTIFTALSDKINTSDIKQDLTSAVTTDVASVPAIAAALDSKHPTITSDTSLTTGTLDVSGNLTVSGSVSGDIFSNFSAGTGITLTQNTPTVGITQITATNSGGGGGGGSDPPISRIYSRYQSSFEAPPNTSRTYYPTFDTATSATCPHVTYVAGANHTAGGKFFIQTAGTYKITYTMSIWSYGYGNRVNWVSRLLRNGNQTSSLIYIHTQGSNTQYQQYATGSSTVVLDCVVNDRINVITRVGKNISGTTSEWRNLRGNAGSRIVIELIS